MEQDTAGEIDGLQDAVYKGLFEFSMDGISILDTKLGKYVMVNQAKLNLMAYSQEQYLALDPIVCLAEIQPDGRTRETVAKAHIEQLTSHGFMFDTVMLCKSNGEGIMCELNARKLNAPNNHLVLILIRDISHRIEAKNKLREQVNLFKAIFNNSVDGILLFDNETKKIKLANDVFCQRIGYTLDELQEIGVFNLFDKEQPNGQNTQDFINNNDKKCCENQSVRYQIQYVRKDFSTFLAEVQTIQLPKPDEHITVSIIRDITKAYYSQKYLQESEQMFRGIFENSALGVILVDENTQIEMANNAFCNMLGYNQQDVLGKSILYFTNEQYLEDSKKKTLSLFKDNQGPLKFERKYYKKDGTIVHVRVSTRLLVLGENQEKRIIAVIDDISEYKKAIQNRIDSELKLKEAASLAKMAYWELDYKMNTFVRSPEFFDILEIDSAYLPNRIDFLSEFVVEKDKARVLENWNKRLLEHDSKPIEFEIATKDGKWKYVREIFKIKLDSVGEIDRVFGIVQDITAKKLAYLALELSEARFRRLAENSPNIIFKFIINPEPKLEYISPSVKHIFGFSQEELYGWRNIHESMLVDKRLARVIGKYIMNGEWDKSLICQMKKSNGEYIWVDLKSIPIYDNENEIVAFEGVVTDISLLKQNEQKLLEQKAELITKNDELEQFTYIASHDLRSPVVNITSLLDMFDEDSLLEYNKTILDKIRITSKKLYETLHDLIDVIAIQNRTTSPFEKLDFNECLQGILAQLSEPIKNTKAEINIDLAVEEIHYIRIHLKSILQNLLTNAIKYRDENRKLVINIRTIAENGYVLLTVQDNGLGIDLDRFYSRLFGMFQVFHKGKGGKGLGLFIIKKQIEQFEGKIEVESTVGVGSTFMVYLKEFSGE